VAGYNLGSPLDSNDGVVFIESNDYNDYSEGENYQIYGAQILGSTQGVSGEGIDLNGATGKLGGSDVSNLRDFPTDPDYPGISTSESSSEPIKISDIGFVLNSAGSLNGHLQIDVSMVDADGDITEDQTLNVDIITDKTYVGTLGVADTFDFNLLSDSPAGDGKATITNFEQDGLTPDWIDLSDIGSFTYIGSAGFTGVDQVRFDTGTKLLEANVSGDTAPELQIGGLAGINAATLGDNLKL
jgi:hypothetical protein